MTRGVGSDNPDLKGNEATEGDLEAQGAAVLRVLVPQEEGMDKERPGTRISTEARNVLKYVVSSVANFSSPELV